MCMKLWCQTLFATMSLVTQTLHPLSSLFYLSFCTMDLWCAHCSREFRTKSGGYDRFKVSTFLPKQNISVKEAIKVLVATNLNGDFVCRECWGATLKAWRGQLLFQEGKKDLIQRCLKTPSPTQTQGEFYFKNVYIDRGLRFCSLKVAKFNL